MKALTHEDQLTLLRQLSGMGSHGRAEGESEEAFPRTFHPVVEHARAFDPDVALIIGPRGSGKTELFRAVIGRRLLPAIARHAPEVRLPPLEPARTRWVPGYPIGAGFPDARGLRRFVDRQGGSPEPTMELWFCYLVRSLREHLDVEAKNSLRRIFSIQGADAIANYDAFRRAGDSPLLALDRLDEKLQKTDSRIFVGYDELDTLGGAVWEVMSTGIRGLVAFWATYTRRWRRIRAKIFLRTDLFQRHATAGGADLAKLAANRAELVWADRNLYAMLLKRIANTSEELHDYCEATHIKFHEDSELHLVPDLTRAEQAKPFVDRLVGPYMGANIKKGLVFRWLLDHIRDGRGHALPRPLVRLVEEASTYELNSGGRTRPPRLLRPVSLRAALDVVSKEHVTQSIDEWPWLSGLRDRLSGDQVPWDRRQQVEKRIALNFAGSWGARPEIRPPTEEPRELVDYLVETGVFRARSDERIDVPDLFLAGLGLKRKGGVRRN